jgi:hypothetical protein
MRFCKTTLWIKKSASRINDMTLTSFGPFLADQAQIQERRTDICSDLTTNGQGAGPPTTGVSPFRNYQGRSSQGGALGSTGVYDRLSYARFALRS